MSGPIPSLTDVQADAAKLETEVAALEQPAADAPVDPTPDESTLPYPNPDQVAMLYSGSDVITVNGITFQPNSIAVLAADAARALAGKYDLRLVEETPDSWPHFLAMRAKLRGARSG